MQRLSDKKNTSKHTCLFKYVSRCVYANCHMLTVVSFISRLQASSIWKAQGGLLTSSLLHMGTVTMHVCLSSSFISSLIFSAITPLATLLLMCVLRRRISSASCSAGLMEALVSNQVTTLRWGVHVCVVFLTVLLTKPDVTLPNLVAQRETTWLWWGLLRTQECQRGNSCVKKLLIISPWGRSIKGH